MADKDLDVYEVVHKTKGTRWFMSEEEIRKTWEPGLAAYRKVREKYLLYP